MKVSRCVGSRGDLCGDGERERERDGDLEMEEAEMERDREREREREMSECNDGEIDRRAAGRGEAARLSGMTA